MSRERLQRAIEEFRLKQARASNRQEAIQAYCCDELRCRGLVGVRSEVVLPGAYRPKKWDVGLVEGDGEVSLGISCKSIIANHGGTVPNRIDDMLGEAANLHRRWSRAVLGYLLMMSRIDESKDAIEKRNESVARGVPLELVINAARRSGDLWFDRLGKSVTTASDRAGPDDRPEKFEVVSCTLLDFDQGPPYPVRYHETTPDPDQFFDRLVEIYQERFG